MEENDNKTLKPTKKVSEFNSETLMDLFGASFVYLNSKNPLKIMIIKE